MKRVNLNFLGVEGVGDRVGVKWRDFVILKGEIERNINLLNVADTSFSVTFKDENDDGYVDIVKFRVKTKGVALPNPTAITSIKQMKWQIDIFVFTDNIERDEEYQIEMVFTKLLS